MGCTDALISHVQRIQALVEGFDILLPRESPPRVVRRQQEFRSPEVVVRTKMSAATADRVFGVVSEFGNSIASALPCAIPTVGISRPYVFDCLEDLRRIGSVIRDVVQRPQSLKMVRLLLEKFEAPCHEITILEIESPANLLGLRAAPYRRSRRDPPGQPWSRSSMAAVIVWSSAKAPAHCVNGKLLVSTMLARS